MNENESLIKCNTCKIIKSKTLFYRYKYCKNCHIKSYIKNHLLEARVANHFNLSIDELNNIMTINMNDFTRNEIGEHEKYDEIMCYYQSIQNTIISDDIIKNDFVNYLSL